MPSLFPGMDPYLEHPEIFPDFHDRLVTYLSDALQPRLPEPYYSAIGRRAWMEVSERYIGSDVNVIRPRQEPDVIFIDATRNETQGYPDGADLVMQVVSEGHENRRRDLHVKLQEYAQAGIAEYWIIDAEDQVVIVNRLTDGQYSQTKYSIDSIATSQRLPGLNIAVADAITAANGPRS